MIDKIDELLKSGISVFKIEGRGRSPEYVETVTRVYRSALEDVSTGKYTKKKIQMYFHDLEKVFNRKLSHGNYYLGTEIEQYNDSYGSRAKEEKQYLGKVTNYFPKAGVAEVSIESGILKKGDAFIILGATTGVCRGVIQELRNEMGGSVKIARRQIVSFLVDQRVRRKDSVYLIKSR